MFLKLKLRHKALCHKQSSSDVDHLVFQKSKQWVYLLELAHFQCQYHLHHTQSQKSYQNLVVVGVAPHKVSFLVLGRLCHVHLLIRMEHPSLSSCLVVQQLC
jgi:hypothetical protein